ncbi:sulfatase [Rubinisphaera margarita]|uniref:sulfatase n=1 Tax=Rubinisphaera margarita TaxID=2909586 RepID=UPI001EE827E3|nr:sulfatase [Rubinisphaera margarita]MCG6157466.1 sulfatase [Rubinisphaera margarita]
MTRLLLIVSLGFMLSPGFVQAEARRNVLMIAVDDLAGALGCYGNTVVKTPHIDQLASEGVVFRNAYCQLPLCNPSRASLLTGRRPDQIRVYDLDRHFREELPDLVTLPQLLKQNGWFSARVGKLYHYNVPAGIGTDGLDDPPSWEQVINPKGRDTREEELIFNPTPQKKISAAMCWLAADGTDEEQTDGMITTEAIELLRKRNREQPFFLGVGFFRPHTPYVAPKKYFDMYPLESIQLPYAPEGDRDDIPPAAFAHNCPIPNYGLDELTCRKSLQAYYACVSFVDAQVGRLLKALDEEGLADSTTVVLWSDHGYHLGEHNGIWQKRCLFEESAGAPLLIREPGASGNGTACEKIVEFIDIYPTVVDLCGLEVPDDLPGTSLKLLLENPQREWSRPAYTQVLRPGDGEPVMGRSIRTDRWRYTEWNRGEEGRELYDHQTDPHEFNNLADDDQFVPLMRRLRRLLDQHIEGTVPATPFEPSRL